MIDPKPDNHSPEVWAAISYSREWALTQGKIENREIISLFNQHYPPGEHDRKMIMTTIHTMNFANRFMNTWTAVWERYK